MFSVMCMHAVVVVVRAISASVAGMVFLLSGQESDARLTPFGRTGEGQFMLF